jgi:GDPmannose 4,6-dehydratase
VRALITGITGQDGSYLAEHLAADGVEVYGLLHGQRNPRRAWLESLVPGIRLVEGDLLDESSLRDALTRSQPDVVYNLGALTFVGMSWQQPSLMTEVTGLGVLRLLEAVRAVDPGIRVVQASTSEMFGSSPAPQNEATPFQPRSPYGTAKLFAHHTAVNYRESYGLHVSTAIMFNHESPRRGEEFVTRKVTAAAARIAAGRQHTLGLGNLTAQRDWGWAPDYVAALPLMAARLEPDDYVLATGESNTVAALCRVAFAEVGLDWTRHVVRDPSQVRPADVEHLEGDAGKARRVLGWTPTLRFEQIVAELVRADVAAVAA